MADYFVVIEEKLNLIAGLWAPLVVHVKQYDGDYTRQMKFTLYYGDEEFQIPYGTKIVISGTKPDRNGFSYFGTFSNSVVTAPLLKQMTIVDGPVPCEITLFNSDDNQIGSATFILYCERAALQSSTLESSNDFQTFVSYVDEAKYYEELSKSYAVGDSGIRTNEDSDNSRYYCNASKDNADASEYWAGMSRSFVGITPTSVRLASGMLDTSKVYIYTGSESGYNTGDWYYYDGSSWVSGGSYLHLPEDLLSYNVINTSMDIILLPEEGE